MIYGFQSTTHAVKSFGFTSPDSISGKKFYEFNFDQTTGICAVSVGESGGEKIDDAEYIEVVINSFNNNEKILYQWAAGVLKYQRSYQALADYMATQDGLVVEINAIDVPNPAPGVSLSPQSINFGNIEIGQASAEEFITVTNTGNADLTTIAASISGDYAVTTQPATLLTPGQTTGIGITFTPAAADTRTGVLSVASDAASSPDTAALLGFGFTPSVGQRVFGSNGTTQFPQPRLADTSASPFDNSGLVESGAAIRLNGTNAYVTAPPVSGIKTISLYVNPATTTEELFDLSATLSVSLVAGVVTLNGAWPTTSVYVDGVLSSAMSTGWHKLVFVLATDIEVDNFELGRIGSAYGQIDVTEVEMWTEAWNAAEVLFDYENPELFAADEPSSVLDSDANIAMRMPLNDGFTDGFFDNVLIVGPNVGNGKNVNGTWLAGVGDIIPQNLLRDWNRRAVIAAETDTLDCGNNAALQISTSDLYVLIDITTPISFQYPVVISKRLRNNVEDQFTIFLRNTDIGVQWSGTVLYYALGAITPGNRHKIEFILSNNILRVNVDDVEKLSVAETTPITANTTRSLFIGTAMNTGDVLAGAVRGVVHEVQIMADSVLVGHWRDNGTASWPDLSGNGSTAVGAEVTPRVYYPDDLGGAYTNPHNLNMNFSGRSTIGLGNNPELTPASYSFAGWFNFPERPDIQTIYSSPNNAGSGGFNLQQLANGDIVLNHTEAPGVVKTVTVTPTDPRGWHAVFGVYGSGNLSLNVDDTWTDSLTGVLDPDYLTPDVDAEIGSLNRTLRAFGPVGDVAIYNKVITPTEMTQLYEASKGKYIPQQPLVSLSPPNLAFPDTEEQSASAPIAVTLTNTGNVDLAISSIAVGPGFTKTHNYAGPVPPSGTVDMTVTFEPQAALTYNDSLTIHSTAPSSPDIVPLSGTGTSIGGGGGEDWTGEHAAPGGGNYWYVTPTGSGAGDGTTYANAWNSLDAVVWGGAGVAAGDTLWVGGTHVHTAGWTTGVLPVPSGTSNAARVTIRGDVPNNQGIVWGAFRLNTVWTSQGGGVWSTPSPGNLNAAFYFEDIAVASPSSFTVLTAKASLAACQAAPGSIYSSDYRGGSLIYVHTTDGLNPTNRIHGPASDSGVQGWKFDIKGKEFITFKNLIKHNIGSYTNYRYGGLSDGGFDNLIWDNCVLDYGAHSLISITGLTTDILIKDCTLRFARNGVYTINQINYTQYSTNLRVIGNEITDIGNDLGVYDRDSHAIGVQGCDQCEFAFNKTRRTGTGVTLYSFNGQINRNTTIHDNDIADTHDDFSGANSNKNWGVDFHGNNVSTADKTGLEIYNNLIQRCKVGIHDLFEDDANHHNNTIKDCQYGVFAVRSWNDGGTIKGPKLTFNDNIIEGTTVNQVYFVSNAVGPNTWFKAERNQYIGGVNKWTFRSSTATSLAQWQGFSSAGSIFDAGSTKV